MSTSLELQNELSPKIFAALKEISKLDSSMDLNENFDLNLKALAGAGENSYGLILQLEMKPKVSSGDLSELFCILKISPKNAARRNHMHVTDYYAREVFMYAEVFQAFRNLIESEGKKPEEVENLLDFIPKMLHYSLDEGDEFIIFEDLTRDDYVANLRIELPSLDMLKKALETLAKLHGLSLALQEKNAKLFARLVEKLQPDNLFTPDIEQVSIEFGKSYIRRALRLMMADKNFNQHKDFQLQMEALTNVEKNFKEICLRAVDGKAIAPYAVINHGDFWNNNILNRFHTHNSVESTKLVDFQMSRYASPILDVIRYLFVSSEQDLRQANFDDLLYSSYYGTLGLQLKHFNLDISIVFPREIFDQQLRSFGCYGLCMAAFSLPFFIADSSDLFDMDEVSQAIAQVDNNDEKEKEESHRKLIEDQFNLLTARTAPIFMRRMAGIVADVVNLKIETKI